MKKEATMQAPRKATGKALCVEKSRKGDSNSDVTPAGEKTQTRSKRGREAERAAKSGELLEDGSVGGGGSRWSKTSAKETAARKKHSSIVERGALSSNVRGGG